MRNDETENLEAMQSAEPDSFAEAVEEEQEPQLNFELKVEKRGTCERHVTVTIPREDIDRYFDREFTELMPKVQVPGFRPGRAPRRLVEARFRKDVAEKVKLELINDSLTQLTEQQQLAAISEPEFDVEALEIPDTGAFTFEFDVEVRPEFELPQWKGLTIEKPIYEFTASDVDKALERLLAERGRLVPFDGPAETGDYISANLTFKLDDKVLSSAEEEVIRIRPVLSFRDGVIENFDRLMGGVRAGETRQGEARLSDDAPNEALRGKTVTAVFEVLEVKRLEPARLTPELLEELGGFRDESELRDAIHDQLERQLEYEQHRRARRQITAALTESADWELPPGLLQRQTRRELQRAVMELQRSGFSEAEIRTHENALWRNSRAFVTRALKEHFILERIAEEEKIDVSPEDYDEEIRLLAAQMGESPRRLRARLEKAGSMDVLRNQIIERKVINRILEHAVFKEVPYTPPSREEEALSRTAGGGEQADIPQAKYDEQEKVPEARGQGLDWNNLEE